MAIMHRKYLPNITEISFILCTVSLSKYNDELVPFSRIFCECTWVQQLQPERATWDTWKQNVCHVSLNNTYVSLLWRHNWHDGVSNHQPRDCLLNRSFRRRSKNTSKLRVTGFVRGIHRWPVNSQHKWPVMRKILPFDDFIMYHWPKITAFNSSSQSDSYIRQ